jgi:hypothetical protein
MELTPRLSRLTRLQHTGRRQKILIFNIGDMSSRYSWNATSGWTGAKDELAMDGKEEKGIDELTWSMY